MGIYDRLTFAEICKLGDYASHSGMFGKDVSPDAGIILAFHAVHKGITLLDVALDMTFPYGRPAKRADAMLADLHREGGRINIVVLTKDECTGTVFHPKNCPDGFTHTITMAEMQTRGYVGKNKMYQTDPKNMLKARWTSEVIRIVCPAANHGTYTPEEIEDFDDTQKQPRHTETRKYEGPEADAARAQVAKAQAAMPAPVPPAQAEAERKAIAGRHKAAVAAQQAAAAPKPPPAAPAAPKADAATTQLREAVNTVLAEYMEVNHEDHKTVGGKFITAGKRLSDLTFNEMIKIIDAVGTTYNGNMPPRTEEVWGNYAPDIERVLEFERPAERF